MTEHLEASLVAALIAGVVDLDSTATWQFMVSQPIVCAPLTGIFLGILTGDMPVGLKLGLMVGTILQLVWIEKLPLGMNVPPDAALASVLSVALGFLAGRGYDTYVEREVCRTVALLFSVAMGLVGRSLDMFIRRVNTVVDGWVTARVEAGRTWAISAGHTVGGLLTFTKAFSFCFLVVYLGVEPIKYFTQSLNFSQNTGFIVIQGMLPTVGFAVLASMCIQSRKELKALLGGIAVCTLLPASVWVAFGAVAATIWGTLRRTNAGA